MTEEYKISENRQANIELFYDELYTLTLHEICFYGTHKPKDPTEQLIQIQKMLETLNQIDDNKIHWRIRECIKNGLITLAFED